MATNRILAAPPEKVFRFLATGDRYADWVVGAKRVRSVDAGWPNPGSSLHHTVGVGPVSGAPGSSSSWSPTARAPGSR